MPTFHFSVTSFSRGELELMIRKILSETTFLRCSARLFKNDPMVLVL